MRSRFFFLLTLSGVLMFSSCSRRDPEALYLTSELPKGVISQGGALQFAFSRAVVPPESTNVWMTTAFVEFKPHIDGKFTWSDTTHLIFSPDAELPGDAKFRGTINGALLANLAHASKYKSDDEFEFSTPSFTLSGAEFFYDRIDNKRLVGLKANLEFTYNINPDDLNKYLKITIDGEPVQTVKIMSSSAAKIIPVEIGITVQYGKMREIKIAVDRDLISPETKTSFAMKEPFVFKLPALDDLKIYGHDFGFDGSASWITLKLSQEVDLSTIKKHITINPSREFTVEHDERMSFRIKGAFEPGTSFHLSVDQGLESILGAKLTNPYEADIVIGNVKPSFGFTSSAGTYMLMSGARKVDIKTVNMTELNVRVSEVFQNNLVHFLYQGRGYDYDYDEEDEGYAGRHRKFRYYLGNYGRVLNEQKISIANKSNQEVTTQLDLAPYIQTDYKGFYLIEISNPAESWRWTSKLVSISDIGMIVKMSAQELLVFAVGLNDNAPIPGVKIDLISSNNQTMASEKTDGNGLAAFYNFAKLSEDFTLKLVTAEKGDDFNFIHLEDYRIETSRYDVAGKQDIEGMYDSFLYGDRNLYRPGEKIFVSGIVRSLSDKILEHMPVKIRIFNPRDFKVSELQQALNEQGSFEINYQTSETAQTGEYRFDLLTGNDVFLSSYRVSVEEFVPDRMRVILTPSKQTAKLGEKVLYTVQANNFFGPPASERKTEFEISFESMPFISKQFPDFRFSDDGANPKNDQVLTSEDKTDASGSASFDAEIPQELSSTGILSMRGKVAVFDESGRPVHQVVQTTIYPKEYYIGVKSHIAYYVAPNAPLKIDIAAVDPGDKPLNGFKAHIEIIRKEWHNVLRLNPRNNMLRYVSEQQEVREKSEDINLSSSAAAYTFSVSRSGDYDVRVSKSGEQGYNQISFYAYEWASTDLTLFEINPEARVNIVLDKAVYAPNDKAHILFQTPFDGKMLVTVERNKVFSYRYLDVKNNSASMDVNVDEDFLPNVYVSAVLFRNIKEQNIPLLTGHGFEPLMVEKSSNKFNVSIDAPEKIRPRTKQNIIIHVPDEKDVFITLAAIDEGICQIKNYRTPDPYGYFYAKKALQTETFDFFRDLIPEPAQKHSSTGGSDDEGRGLRVNPLSVKRFKPVALWSGLKKTDGSGNVNVSLDIPDFNGEVRLMAVAYKGSRFGSSQKAMKIADPIVITPALPRFLSPNDVITMPITAFNTTEKPVTLKFNIAATGGIAVLQPEAQLEVGSNQERFVNVTLKAGNEVGKASVTVQTNAFNEKFKTETEISIRPIAPYVTESMTGFAEAGKSVTEKIPDTFLPYGRRAYLVLSPFPVANMAKQLKDLVGYPYGCLEQTTSKAFPQIYLRDIALLLDPSILDYGSPGYFVNEAISKITSMQLGDGSFSYWPGGDYTNAWTTVYATHFLVEAKRAGYSVPDGTLTAALNFIKSLSRNKETEDYYYEEAYHSVLKRIANKTSIYALYVLALAGQPDMTVMNFYRTSKNLLTEDTKYLLGGAFALSGDRRTYLEIVPGQFQTEEPDRTCGRWFDSRIRANAIILDVLLETDPDNVNIARYMEYLSAEYKKDYWFSTQDNAFTLLGFGKAARRAGGTKVQGTIIYGDKIIQYSGGNQKFTLEQFDQPLSINLQGQGKIYYSIVINGIRKDGKIKIEDKNLRIRREFFDRFGRPAGTDNIKQNSLLVLKLTLQSDVEDLENVAITDLLPAGFEIENPRLSENTQYEFTKDADKPLYFDIRDDRINYYLNFTDESKTKTFYYLVRAVTKGDFNYAPVAAEAMYDENYYSASGGGIIHIVE